MTFENDLKAGKSVEREINRLIRTKYPLSHLIEGKNEGFDIFVPEKMIKVEVKYDRKSNETPNYFFETSNNIKGEPSGIDVTKSDWWVHVDDKTINWIKTKTLKYCLENEWFKNDFSFPLDGKEVTGYLVRKEEVRYSPYVLREDRKRCKTVPF